jgi:hypothetical protein
MAITIPSDLFIPSIFVVSSVFYRLRPGGGIGRRAASLSSVSGRVIAASRAR